MPVDENTLTVTIEGLTDKLTQALDLQTEIRDILVAMQSIAKLPDDSLPVDRGTQLEITQARRDEIYDACIGPANALL